MFAAEVLGPTVDRLAELAGGGRALQFGIGTGCVAVPLSQRGVPVTGINLSRPMIDQLRTKADEATIPVIIGDMATAVAPGRIHARLPRLQRDRQLPNSGGDATSSAARTASARRWSHSDHHEGPELAGKDYLLPALAKYGRRDF
jgi:hypothetical protein